VHHIIVKMVFMKVVQEYTNTTRANGCNWVRIWTDGGLGILLAVLP